MCSRGEAAGPACSPDRDSKALLLARGGLGGGAVTSIPDPLAQFPMGLLEIALLHVKSI